MLKITAITQGPSCDLVLTSGSDVLPQNVSRVAQEYKIWSPSLKPRMDPTPLNILNTCMAVFEMDAKRNIYETL